MFTLGIGLGLLVASVFSELKLWWLVGASDDRDGTARGGTVAGQPMTEKGEAARRNNTVTARQDAPEPALYRLARWCVTARP